MRIRLTWTNLLSLLALSAVITATSCKKEDTSFDPIQVQNVEEKLEGRWSVVSSRAAGEIRVAGLWIQASGRTTSPPSGYWELTRDPHNYTYDMTATFDMQALGGIVKQSHTHIDKDAGTWVVADNEESVVFSGNQGITKRIFFTHYDSLSTLFMRVAVPIDSSYNGYDYRGTIFFEMSKQN